MILFYDATPLKVKYQSRIITGLSGQEDSVSSWSESVVAFAATGQDIQLLGRAGLLLGGEY